MKIFKFFLLLGSILVGLSFQNGWADDLDDLSELAEDGNSTQNISTEDDLEQLSESEPSSEDSELFSEDSDFSSEDSGENDDSESDISLSFGGYIKALCYWNQEKYADGLWEQYQQMKDGGLSAPSKQNLNGFNNAGTRMQLKLEGFIGENARLFSALNVDYNSSASLHSHAGDQEKQNGNVRVVESFIEIYEGSRTWKIGPQIVTWSFMEGIEVPTDRVNARDYSYKSTEYEDGKLPSAGVLLTQPIGDSQLELMFIPVAKTNIDIEFRNYFLQGESDPVEHKPSNAKYAGRFSGSLGNLDYAVSYVEGTDPQPDIVDVPTEKIMNVNGTILPIPIPLTGRTFNRVRSPGVDLQYNFGSWLGKGSFVKYLTADASGDAPTIKNNWSKSVMGAEFTMFDTTINCYAGQTQIENFPEDEKEQEKSFLVGQIRERSDFISGHITRNFLTGNALSVMLMGAKYWDGEGDAIQTNIRANLKYKIADGLEILVGPAYMYMMENEFYDFQTEVKYSF